MKRKRTAQCRSLRSSRSQRQHRDGASPAGGRHGASARRAREHILTVMGALRNDHGDAEVIEADPAPQQVIHRLQREVAVTEQLSPTPGAPPRRWTSASLPPRRVLAQRSPRGTARCGQPEFAAGAAAPPAGRGGHEGARRSGAGLGAPPPASQPARPRGPRCRPPARRRPRRASRTFS